MIKQKNYIQENESFEYIVKQISNRIFLNIQNKISDFYSLNINIDYLSTVVYTEIREIIIQILVQDINDWRKSKKVYLENYDNQYQEYCSIFFEKRYFKVLDKYKMLNKILKNYEVDILTSLSNFIYNIINKKE